MLHDIGKFYQRADKSFSEKRNELSIPVRKIADYICPLNKEGSFGYQHSIWTLQFLTEVETKLKLLPNFSKNLFNAGTQQDSIFELSAYHHKPSTELQALISLADWWSAGIDRREKLEIEEKADEKIIKWGKKRYKRIPLYSVFNNINNGQGSFAFKLRGLSISENNFFPNEIKSIEDGLSELEYANLWRNFFEEFKKLPTDTFVGFSGSLLALLKKYTWCIPSNTTDMSNVSLFDHLKTTAAFADCLYVYKEEYPNEFIYQNQRLALKQNVRPVLLLGGDLSGIQKFIYNIASRKAAVSLKGRSFYLQLLVDSIIQKIIQHEDINASLAHVVYSSGGKFYILLPNTEKVRCAISKLKYDIEKELWKEHHGQLIVNIDYVPFAYSVKEKGIDFDDYTNQEIGNLWKALADRLSNLKSQKFRRLLLDDYDEFFQIQKVGGKTKVCAVTGIESDNCIAIESNAKASEEICVLPIVKKQIDLGNILKDAEYVVTSRADNFSKYIGSRIIDFNILGIHNCFLKQSELVDTNDKVGKITSVDTCSVKRINNTEFIGDATLLKGNSCGYGFQFYGGNKQAQIIEHNQLKNKTFEELSNGSYLGILRMDVDNLGSIFIKGLPEKDKSFSAYSTLSFMLDYFFSGYLNNIREKYKDEVNIIYSGGDDIFAVGKWDKLIDFAADVRKAFTSFVGRDDISISGGIAIVGDNYPIAKSAELAGEAEEKAKKDNGATKNSFNLFGETISWKDEFDYVKNYKNKFVHLVKSEKLPKGILHKIKNYAIVIKNNNNPKTCSQVGRKDMSYIWHAAYYLTRFIERYEHTNKNVVLFCKDLRDNQLIKSRNYELMALAARWAELELKENNK